MAGIIERNARHDAVLMQKLGISDGKIVWEDTPCRCFFREVAQTGDHAFGAVSDGRVFMIAPLAVSPQLPARVRFDGTEFDIQSIQVYRSIRGELLGYKMTVASGGAA